MIANTLLNAVARMTGLTLVTDAAAASFRLTSPDIKPGATIAD